MQLCVAQNHSPEVGLVQARAPQIGSVQFRASELRPRQVTMVLERPLVDHVPAVRPGSGHAGDFAGADPIPRCRRHRRGDQPARQHNPGRPCHQHPTPPHTLSSHSFTVTGPRNGVHSTRRKPPTTDIAEGQGVGFTTPVLGVGVSSPQQPLTLMLPSGIVVLQNTVPVPRIRSRVRIRLGVRLGVNPQRDPPREPGIGPLTW